MAFANSTIGINRKFGFIAGALTVLGIIITLLIMWWFANSANQIPGSVSFPSLINQASAQDYDGNRVGINFGTTVAEVTRANANGARAAILTWGMPLLVVLVFTVASAIRPRYSRPSDNRQT